MDQTAFANQEFLWHLGECCQNANLDRGVNLCFGRHNEKAAQNRPDSLHYSTNFEHHSIRENACFRGPHGKGLQEPGCYWSYPIEII